MNNEFAAVSVLTRGVLCAMLDAMARHKPAQIPPDLRTRLETARLDLLALFRALDRMYLTPEQIPQRLIRQLFELDADYVEALWGLDQPPGKLNLQTMLRDTLAALAQLPAACSRLRKNLPPQTLPTLSQLELAIRAHLNPAEAYNMLPGKNPQIV
ncbi:MAG: hypothetical protein WBF04_00350 [Candidatus Sulfotelmatobacter sp.]